MLNHISPLPLVRKTSNMLLNNLYVCSFIVTKNIAKTQKLTVSQMSFREISHLNRTSPQHFWTNSLNFQNNLKSSVKR